MIPLPELDADFLLGTLEKLLNIPSPTGFADFAVKFCEKTLENIPGVTLSPTHKGALLASLGGERDDHPRALTAHVDTLGAMVKEIKSNGRLKLTRVGGFAWNTVEGEGCTIFTHSGRQVRGALLLTKASGHVFGGQTVNETKRDEDSLEVRLDAHTLSDKETRELGISVGDFVAFDPRVEIINGFVRSRHLDDKACVAVLLAVLKTLAKSKLKPAHDTSLLISNYEEVGHGAAAGIPSTVEELLVVDMAAVGEGQNSDEFHASICVKDSGGPYHHAFSNRLRDLADKYNIPYKVDIYPHYGSDGEAWWSAGADAEVALIGPGVDASHNYERTHTEALLATARWVLAYLLNE